MNIRQQLDAAGTRLADQGTPGASPWLEAEIFMAHALEVSRSFLYTHPELEVPPLRGSVFRHLVQKRLKGEPVAYLLGECEFWTLNLKVNPHVLIPRHETELLVETALERLPAAWPQRMADLGTGSGAIALALASERRGCDVQATELSPEAMGLAKENATRLQISNVEFHLGSWCEPLTGMFDLIVSNPPYVAADDPHLDLGDCRFEPRLALTPGDDGLGAFRAICKQAFPILNDGALLVFEHGFDQGEAVRGILADSGFRNTETISDLAGMERVSLGRKPA